jgi:SAM-dependent methyltransferase
MTDAASVQASLELTLKDEIVRMYQEVANNPTGEFHFFHGRDAAQLFGYAPEWLDRAPAGAVSSFAGVGNPHERSNLQPGETVLDLGSGAGLDAMIASWRVGPTGRVMGIDLNPAMCLKAQAHAAASGAKMECLGQLNRRCSPGGRDVQAAGRDGLHSRPVGRGPEVPVPERVDAELGRGVRRQGGDDDRIEAGSMSPLIETTRRRIGIQALLGALVIVYGPRSS